MIAAVDFFALFSGAHKACGLVIDPFGNVTKQFTGTLRAQTTQDTCNLHEEFLFDDGNLYTRDWVISRTSDQTYTATAFDVVGRASAITTGNTVRWDYKQRLAIGKSGLLIGVTDYMVFMPNGVTLGYTKLRKFGLPVGKLITSFQRQSPVL